MHSRIDDGLTSTVSVGTEKRMSEVKNSDYPEQSPKNSREEEDRGLKGGTSGGGEGISMDQNDRLKERMERMILMSLAIKLDKISRRAGQSTSDEVITMMHDKNFNLATFKNMLKTTADCRDISESIIHHFKE